MRVTLTLASGCYGPDAAIPASSVLHGENSYINDCTSRQSSTLQSFFFFQAEDGIRDIGVTGVQTCALPISFTFQNIPPTYTIARSMDAAAKVYFVPFSALEKFTLQHPYYGRWYTRSSRCKIGRASCRERV